MMTAGAASTWWWLSQPQNSTCSRRWSAAACSSAAVLLLLALVGSGFQQLPGNVQAPRSRVIRRLLQAVVNKPWEGKYKPPNDGEYEPPIRPEDRTTLETEPSMQREHTHIHSKFRFQQRRADHVPGYVALCLIVRDQHRDIAEWLDWHLSIGVDRFYVFDHGSNPPMNTTLQHYMAAGQVEYHHINKVTHFTHKPQLQVYDTCLQEFRHRHQWIGFIDVDEFIFVRNRTQDLPSLLQDYEDYGGLAVAWVMMGSSGHVQRPNGTLRSYHTCLEPTTPDTRHVKIIANTKWAAHPWRDPHTFVYYDEKFAVNEKFERVDFAALTKHTSELVALHHYAIKSLEDFQDKMARGTGMQNHKTMAFFEFVDSKATANCSDLQQLVLQMEVELDEPPPAQAELEVPEVPASVAAAKAPVLAAGGAAQLQQLQPAEVSAEVSGDVSSSHGTVEAPAEAAGQLDAAAEPPQGPVTDGATEQSDSLASEEAMEQLGDAAAAWQDQVTKGEAEQLAGAAAEGQAQAAEEAGKQAAEAAASDVPASADGADSEAAAAGEQTASISESSAPGVEAINPSDGDATDPGPAS